MKQILLSITSLFLFVCTYAQTGPWAKYDATMKGEALVREADGGYIKEMQSILEGGGDVNFQIQPSGLTALMVAASGGKTEVVSFLLKRGAIPNVKDANGRTALDRARMAGATEIVKQLSFETATTSATPPIKKPPVLAAESVEPTKQTISESPKSNNNLWALFGSFKVGDEVRFFNGSWKNGKIKEVGAAGDYKSKRAEPGERKYLIAREGAYNWNEWIDWGLVTGLNRESYWTDFFIGNWALGEVMAMTTKTDGGYQRDEYSFHSAKEALEVRKNFTYRWKSFGKIINGKWKAAEDGAGIVLLKGFQGLDWTLRNETNATEENIRAMQSARLTTEGKMSIRAKRAV